MDPSYGSHPSGPRANGRPVSILVVDDDEVDVRSITRAFRNRGIDNPIVTARDGVEALEVMRGAEGAPRLEWPYVVLLDLNMPRMDGLELLEAMRADPELARTIVFVLTTSNDDRDKARAYDSHIAGYLLKTSAGLEFLNLVTMLEKFVLTVRFPAESP